MVQVLAVVPLRNLQSIWKVVLAALVVSTSIEKRTPDVSDTKEAPDTVQLSILQNLVESFSVKKSVRSYLHSRMP